MFAYDVTSKDRRFSIRRSRVSIYAWKIDDLSMRDEMAESSMEKYRFCPKLKRVKISFERDLRMFRKVRGGLDFDEPK